MFRYGSGNRVGLIFGVGLGPGIGVGTNVYIGAGLCKSLA